MNRQLDIKRIEKISKALGDPYRLQMLDAVKNQKDWMPCANVVELFGLAQSTVSHHLKQLVDADILLCEKDGRCTRYSINKEVLEDYANYMNSLVK